MHSSGGGGNESLLSGDDYDECDPEDGSARYEQMLTDTFMSQMYIVVTAAVLILDFSLCSAHRIKKTSSVRARSVSGSFSGTHQQNLQDESEGGEHDAAHFGSGWSQGKKRVVGLIMAMAAGLMFGASFNPAQYVIDNRYDGDDNSLNSVFPHFCGIWLASWWYMLLYGTYKYFRSEELYVNPKSILPGALAGFMWGIACIAWFVANGKLGFSISFPLITSGPGFVGSMYGVFLFDEISGKKNFIILGSAFAITMVGLIFIALSH